MSFHSPHARKVRFAIWSAVVAIFVVALGWLWQTDNIRLQTDLLRLLPDADLPADASAALRKVELNTTDQFTLYLIGDDLQQLTEQAVAVQAQLVADDIVASVTFQRVNHQAELLQVLKSGRFNLLSAAKRKQLQTQPELVVSQAVRRAYQPVASNPIARFDEDPLGLFTDYLAQLPKPLTEPGWLPASANGVPAIEHGLDTEQIAKRYSVALYGGVSAGPYSPETQDQLELILTNVQRDLPAEVQLVYSGAIFHIAVATRQARYEMSTIGTASLLGIVVLLALAFRGAVPIVLSLAGIASGVLTASVVTLLWFGEMHVLTLVFGASLTGMSIDYAFHYFASPKLVNRRNRLQQVLPGISIGVLTSVVAFLCLLFAPFPGLQQMAIFAAVGLTSAYCCVLCWYPLLSQNIRDPNTKLLQLSRRFSQWPEWAGQYFKLSESLGRVRIAVCAVLGIGLVAGGLCQLAPNDDIRLLYQPSGELETMEQQAQVLQRDRVDRRLLLFGAASSEALINREKQLRTKLKELVVQQAMTHFWSFGHYLPTPEQQQKNSALYGEQVMTNDGVLVNFAQKLGLDNGWLQQQRSDYQAGRVSRLDIAKLAADYPESFGQFWLGNSVVDSDFFAVIALGGINDPVALKTFADANTNVYFIDHIGMTSAAFTKYRKMSLWFTALAYGIILLMLLWRYPWRMALRAFAGPTTAAIVTLAILGWLGITVNLFTAFALIVVLGVGIDYAVFFAESGRRSAHTMLAVMLSATTTVLAFGLLALSETMALYTFGLTLWIGITLAFVLAPALAPTLAPKLEEKR